MKKQRQQVGDPFEEYYNSLSKLELQKISRTIEEKISISILCSEDGCRLIDVSKKENVIVKDTKGKFLYSLYFNSEGKKLKKRFAVSRAFCFSIKHLFMSSLTCSHLCHNSFCVNKTHITMEPLCVNMSRNYCSGGVKCEHVPICIAEGINFQEISKWKKKIENEKKKERKFKKVKT